MTYLIKNPVPKDVNMIYCFSSTNSWQPGTNGNYIYPLNKIIKSGNSNVTLNTSTYELNLSNKRYVCFFRPYAGGQGSSTIIRVNILLNGTSIENITSYNDNVAAASGHTGLDTSVVEFFANANDKLKIQFQITNASTFIGYGEGVLGLNSLFIVEYDT